jgi:hypothetical protein
LAFLQFDQADQRVFCLCFFGSVFLIYEFILLNFDRLFSDCWRLFCIWEILNSLLIPVENRVRFQINRYDFL